ncbi:hypothetical protein Tco_1206497, partial [Tanacetum coccineum]
RGISKFYDGKSKSYGSLADAAKVSSIQDIVKKEDAYSRKRKNMIAHTVLLEKLCNSSSENGVPKRLARCAESGETAKKSSLMVGGGRPPLYRNGRRAVNDGSLDSSRGVYRAPRKSLSLSDLMSGVTGLVSSKRDEKVSCYMYRIRKVVYGVTVFDKAFYGFSVFWFVPIVVAY